ncbi:Protein of unknown function [Propionibacterium freudenreichii]|nr:Protein of unknown function [Propionibacterium freudenreichii]
MDRLRNVLPTDSHHPCNGPQRQSLLVESNRLGGLVSTESRRSPSHASASEMSGDCRAMNPVRLGEAGNTGTTAVVLDQPCHF